MMMIQSARPDRRRVLPGDLGRRGQLTERAPASPPRLAYHIALPIGATIGLRPPRRKSERKLPDRCSLTYTSRVLKKGMACVAVA